MQTPHTFYAVSTLWGSDYPGALERAIEEFKEKYPDRKPSVVLLHPGAPEIEIAEGLKVVRKRTVPLGEVWVG